MINIIKAEKRDEDCLLVINWRNDIITRKMFYNSEKKIWNKFKREYYDKYFENIPLFAILDNRKIAFLSFVKKKDNYHISINIDPEYRGKKLAVPIITKSLEYIKNNYKNIDIIIAEVKSINVASIKTFINCNFKKIEENDNILIFQYKF